jgi:N6-adenosine-specific RNA methylase IME4
MCPSAPVEVDLALCYPSLRPRRAAAAVKALAASIAEIGLVNPITVRRAKAPRSGRPVDSFEVVAGWHRVKAFRRLGRETIPAFVVELDDMRAELALIDENLCRNDLTPAERAAATARRKVVYIWLHPETRHGANQHTRGVANLATPEGAEPVERFTAATAEATGNSERAVRRDAQRGEALGDDALRVARTSLDKGEELDALAKMAPEARAALIERAAAGEKVSAKVEAKKQSRDAREAALAEKQRALPEAKFGVILADPEWRFEPWSRETGLDRAADNHYPTSDLATIKARDVASIAADDCVLFLWSPGNRIADAIDVMRGWGFAYVSQFVWAKAKAGTGYWVRDKHEVLLIGKRGAPPAPAPGTQAESLILAPQSEHSAKPEIFLEIVERYFPRLAKIELNRRGPLRPGWSAWGNEAEAEAAAGRRANRNRGFSAAYRPPEASMRENGSSSEPFPEVARRRPQQKYCSSSVLFFRAAAGANILEIFCTERGGRQDENAALLPDEASPVSVKQPPSNS